MRFFFWCVRGALLLVVLETSRHDLCMCTCTLPNIVFRGGGSRGVPVSTRNVRVGLLALQYAHMRMRMRRLPFRIGALLDVWGWRLGGGTALLLRPLTCTGTTRTRAASVVLLSPVISGILLTLLRSLLRVITLEI